jgi:hypothetical protein
MSLIRNRRRFLGAVFSALLAFALFDTATAQEAKCRQIRPGGGKERGPGAARGSAQERKARSVQGKHRAGAKVLRQARAAHAGAGLGPATCGLEIYWH